MPGLESLEACLKVAGDEQPPGALGRRPVAAFAYPNGGQADVTPVVRSMVADAGFRFAVTLLPGPARAPEVRADPLMVRRVFVHHRDDPASFAAKVLGVARATAWAR